LDGQFLVVLHDNDKYDTVAYWSSAPKQHLELKNFRFGGYSMETPVQTTLPDGSITLSGKEAFRAGDVPKSPGDYATDGARFWVYEWKTKTGLVEYDPMTGKKLGIVTPEVFTGEAPTPPKPKQDGTPQVWTTDWRNCELALAPAGYSHSPLGIANGVIGRTVRSTEDENQTTRIDGVTTGGVTTLVTWPGADKPVAVSHDRESNSRFYDGDGACINLTVDEDSLSINNEDWVGRGWPTVVPPLAFWHMFVTRDAAASTALRAATTEQARALITVALGERNAEHAMPNTEAKIEEVFGTADPALVKGIAGYVERAAELQARLPEIIAERAKENADPSGGSLTGQGVQFKKLMAALVGGRDQKLKDQELDPDEYLRAIRGTAMAALAPIADAKTRNALKDKIRAVLATPFADDTSKLRLIPIVEPDGWEWPEDYDTVVIQTEGESTFLILGSNNLALEYSRDGQWRVPTLWNLGKEPVITYAPVGTGWGRAFLDLPEEGIPWDPAIATELAARAGLTEAEAKLLYCGMPTGWSKDFLGKQKRELIDLKRDDADAARAV
ncbi:MAG TPA: hypothetical protein VGC41_27200, partial [Kofleriaceae bacterium]